MSVGGLFTKTPSQHLNIVVVIQTAFHVSCDQNEMNISDPCISFPVLQKQDTACQIEPVNYLADAVIGAAAAPAAFKLAGISWECWVKRLRWQRQHKCCCLFIWRKEPTLKPPPTPRAQEGHRETDEPSG